jgi:hypothetical protein
MRPVRRCIPLAVVVAACLAHPLTASAGAGNTLHELALRYAPVVRLSEQEAPCARGESFEPIDVNAIFGQRDVVLRGPSNLAKTGPTALDLAPGLESYALDFPGNALSSSACSYEQWQRRITVRYRPTVSAHVATESGRLALPVLVLLRHNDFNNLHEGHWELIQLDFDAATPAAALRTAPFEVGYSQHVGAERAEWDAPKLELAGRTHPIVSGRGLARELLLRGALPRAQRGRGPRGRRLERALARAQAEGGGDPGKHRGRGGGVSVARIQGPLGRAAPGFYDAPTGPNTKDEWTQPLTWANGTWRSKSFALAGGRSLGPTATKFFCTAVGGASTALILVATHPSASLTVVLVALALLLWLATRTRWRPGPSTELRRQRSWGSLVTAAARSTAATPGSSFRSG